MNIRDILEHYKTDERVRTLAEALNAGKAPRIQLRGLVGSGDATVAVALYFLQHAHMIFVLPDREEAGYFQADLENLTGKEILLFPSSYRKAFEFTQPDSSNVLARAEVLNELNHSSEFGRLIVTYPEALAEKVIDRASLEKNTLEIAVSNKLSIDFINEFLIEYDFDRVDFVYEPGQFSIRGGIVDIFSFSHNLPYRVEFFGDFIESIRTFEIESQLSVEQVKTITIVPNVQSKFLTENNISLLEYVDPGTQLWIKDVQFTLDIIKSGFKKAVELWKALSADEKQKNPDWIDPKFGFTDERLIADQLHDFPVIEFGKQFFYQANQSVDFDMRPQPSFNKDFSLLIHNFKNNDAEHIENYILTDSARQVERLYAILEDLDKTVKFTPISISIREGFVDREQKLACYTDHQIFDRYYKYKLKKGYQRSQAITLKELRELKPGDYVTHIDHGIGKYAGLEKVEVNDKMQEMIRLVYADNDLLYVNINSLNRISKYSGKEG
ncbi:MAG: CarD family transcriptional regulator, partial [Mucilaginibacter sp.]